jgi:transposase
MSRTGFQSPRDEEEILLARLKMVQYTRESKTLRLFIPEKLVSNVLSSHIRIVHVIRLDEGYPESRLSIHPMYLYLLKRATVAGFPIPRQS